MPVARTLWNLRIPMRDGVHLAADVLLPPGEGPYPTVLLRSPYVRSRSLSNPHGWIRLLDYGYVLVTVDIRGRNDSEGTWTPWVKDPQDGHDVVEWIAQQSWCSGRIGMVGGSYEGLTQWWTALGRPKHLACIAPLCIGGVPQRRPFGTGIPLQYWLWWMTLVLGKTLQYPGAPCWEASIMRTPIRTLDQHLGLSRSEWHRYVADEIDISSDAATLSAKDYADIDIPVFVGVGWWDDQETLCAWEALQQARSAAQCRLLVGAWDHAGNTAPRPVLGGLDVSASMMDTIGYIERFLALHLKHARETTVSMPRCRVFRTGEDQWDELDRWPPPEVIPTPFYLSSHGNARGLAGDGVLTPRLGPTAASDSFRYDPNAPGRDMSNLAVFAWTDPPLDYRYLQRRKDCLVYTSARLDNPLAVSGQYHLRVFISCDRPDTDLYCHLSDVHPGGRAVGLAVTNMPPLGALRLRYRNGATAELLTPGKIYEVELSGSWLHHIFKAGHRVRLTIHCGHFPHMARNAGSGLHWAADTVLFPQTSTLYHSSAQPSRVLLPVVARTTR